MVPISTAIFGIVVYSASAAPTATMNARSPSSSKTVIIQMFQWTWDSIASECTNSIGPAGYGFVQVSPPQEHITGTQWWTDYQPVSYTLTSKRGNRDQFSNMVTTCHNAGVLVIADTIWNHMSALDSGTGVAANTFTHYVYPGIYQNQDFHHCGLEPNDSIVNYNNRLEVQTCQLDGLADLGTDTEYVRGRLAKYANDLLSIGVDGLRLDAAKRKFFSLSYLARLFLGHMATGDVNNMIGRLSRGVYITQEVIFGAGEPITPAEYVQNGDVQEFRYTSTLQSAFSGGGISSLENLENRGWVPGSSANVFVANHDTERNGNSLNVNSPSNTYILATVFSLAHPYGTPTILSSYTYSNTDDGAPNNGRGTCSGAGGSGGWHCQHRWDAFTGMVGFRNKVGSAALNNWKSPQSSQIAFGRGSLGFVAINNADSKWSESFTTSLPDGTYCNVIQGSKRGSGCNGMSFTVSGGKFSATINSRDAIAIHTGQQA